MCSPWRGREEGQACGHLRPKLQQSEHTEVDGTGRDRMGGTGREGMLSCWLANSWSPAP